MGPLCDWTTRWPAAVQQAGGLDVALVLGGNWDIAGRMIPSLGVWLTVGDPAYDTWLEGELGGAADALHDAGAARVVWMTLPVERGTDNGDRVDRFNALVAEAAATRPWLVIADYAGFLEASGRDAELRPDGVHLGNTDPEAGAQQVSRLWLNDVLRQAASS